MPRVFKDNEIVIASHNSGKVTEIGELLKPFGMRAISASNLGLEEPDETGKTFSENAELKAKHAASACSKPALADDSGLCVDLLGGKPGIYSARWAGKDKNFSVGKHVLAETRSFYISYFIAFYYICIGYVSKLLIGMDGYNIIASFRIRYMTPFRIKLNTITPVIIRCSF